MSELHPEPRQAQPVRRRGSGVAIAAIVATTIVILACIAATTIVAYIFLQSAPW